MATYQNGPKRLGLAGVGGLGWFTPPSGNTMHGIAAMGLVGALSANDVWVGFNAGETKTHISHTRPELYRGHTGQFLIGYTDCESTKLPASWTHYMATRDEIWAPSQFCSDVFIQSNMNDVVRVIPYGIDGESWPIVSREVSDTFYFLHVGGDSPRHGAQRVVDVFLELFSGRGDVRLIIQSSDPSSARWGAGATGGEIAHPQITTVADNLNHYELLSLHRKAHCMVYPTNGEGFGLEAFQAISTALPTICTNATGCADFANLSIPLNAGWTDAPGPRAGEWADPDMNHLSILMQSAVENWPRHRKKAMKSAKIIHSTQTWDHIAKNVINILGDKIYDSV